MSDPSPAERGLIGIGEAAERAGVSERALRYYEEIGLICPCGHTPGGMRRYSDDNLGRVTRIRELQTILGLNLDEIRNVLANDDRVAELRVAYRAEDTDEARRRELIREGLALTEELQRTVEAKRTSLDRFVAELDERRTRLSALLAEAPLPVSPGGR